MFSRQKYVYHLMISKLFAVHFVSLAEPASPEIDYVLTIWQGKEEGSESCKMNILTLLQLL